MKLRVVCIASCVLILFSCKKKYTCECHTIRLPSLGAPQNPRTNYETYNVKEKTKFDAQANCVRQYEASGKATNGASCELK